jgi:hypothetical protein
MRAPVGAARGTRGMKIGGVRACGLRHQFTRQKVKPCTWGVQSLGQRLENAITQA